MAKKLRGTGVRHTIPFVGRFAGLWLVVTIAAVLVASGSSYMLFAERFGDDSPGLMRALAVQTVLTVLAVVALAVFTTHRLAGPWIAVRRACEAVRDGNLSLRLRIRASDVHVKNVERAFNEMIDALEGKTRSVTLPDTSRRPA
jgi:methyl-accepting chemotaxis protein